MRNLLTLLILVCSITLHLHAQSLNSKPLVIGQQLEFQSEILGQSRVLNIYLPNSYAADSIKTYPVIYLLDGSIDEDFIHISGLVQFMSFPWLNYVPESIVVGIANIDRKHDFTLPTENEEMTKAFPTTGGSAAFIEFLEKEVQPLVRAHFRTEGSGTLIGQSLGGLLATEILFKKPDMFGNYIIISPSLWWDDESLLKMDVNGITEGKSIYVGVGKEGKVMEADAKELFKKLNTMQAKKARVFFGFFPEQDHADALHQAAYDAFMKLFSGKEK